LRPGEKLSEELFGTGEEPRSTQHPKILVARGNHSGDHESLFEQLEELKERAQDGEIASLLAKVQEIVPEYEREPTQQQKDMRI
jgi:FlaA1/EpsC-like NDP-sugar epimerase